jgi:hypothetical protein
MNEVRELLTLAPSQEQRQELIDNILWWFDHATPDQFNRGMAWYRNAHDLAGMVGGGDYSKGAGVIAALSANTGWDLNRKLALAISAGAKPLTVLGKGLKTQSFYLNIFRPDMSGAVTVDRHAHDVARNQVWGSKVRGLSTAKRYQVLADSYRDAATHRNVRPHEMQAIVWVVWTEEIAGTSTRPKVRKD